MTNFVSYAQNFEDVLLWRALGHIKNGAYIDIGAQHPVDDSVSMAFYERGWRGLHVEPVPYYAELLRTHRQGEIVIQAALASKRGKLRFFELPNTGLSTGDPEIFRLHNEAGLRGKESVVEAITLSSIFSKLGKVEIHWMKVDVEGMELEVLRGWRQSKARPWVVVVESTLPNSPIESFESWEPELVGRGYEFAYFDGLNRYYVAPMHRDLLPALRCGANVFDRFIPIGILKLEEKAHYLAERNALLSVQLTKMNDAMSGLIEGSKLAAEQLAERAREIRIAHLESLLADSPIALGERRTILFTQGHSTDCLISGCSMPESWGTWSNSLISRIDIPVNGLVPPEAEMFVRMPIRLPTDLLELAPVLKISSQGLDVCFVFFRPDASNEQEIAFSIMAVSPRTTITFQLTHLSSPGTRPASTDSRLLGFGINLMHVEISASSNGIRVGQDTGPLLAIGNGELLLLQNTTLGREG